MEVLYWVLAVVVVYPYLIYPVVLWVCSRAFGRHGRPPTPTPDQWPRVSILIAAHNEEKLMGARIENALATDYPKDRLEIVIASDASTDGTVRIIEQYAHREVRCLAFTERRGKATSLRAATETLTGDIVVLSDANSFLRPGAVKAMARWFLTPSVGVVCGKLLLADEKRNQNCDGLYWRFETMLKQAESRLGALLGTNGAIYAIRRGLLGHLPAGSINDDLELPLLAKLRTRCDLLFEREALADEETPARITLEFRRRSRIGVGAFQSLERIYPVLNPLRGWIAFTFVSHKLLRWVGPFLLIALAAVNVALLDQPVYRALMLLQAAFYLIATAGLLLPVRAWPKAARLPALFVTVNAALFVGFCKWLCGQISAVWQPTQRAEAAPTS